MSQRQVEDRIPALARDSEVAEQIYDALDHDRYKEKIEKMIVAYTGTVEFEELVMKYAGKEYDNRLLKSSRFWTATIITTIVTTIISVGITLAITYLVKSS